VIIDFFASVIKVYLLITKSEGMRGLKTPPIDMLSFASTSNNSAKLCKTKTKMRFLAPIGRSE